MADEDLLAHAGSALPPAASSCHVQDSTSVGAGVYRGKACWH